MNDVHVVLGSGQVGPRLATVLEARGHRVRTVRRSPGADVQADLSDRAAAIRACEGASVIYDCTNPAGYGTWETTLPPLKRGIRAAAAETGAFLVSLDNLYCYGQSDAPITEETPMRPCSAKGKLRAELADELLSANARGEVRATIARASDFFGPGAGAMSIYGERFVKMLRGGWGAMVLGDPRLPRSYSYVPDVAAGLATLGEHPERAGEVFHLPVAWRDGSTLELVERFAAALGAPARAWRMPRWAFRLLGVVSRDLGAVAEMLYQWEAPYVVDDGKLTRAFGVKATPIEAAIRASIAG